MRRVLLIIGVTLLAAAAGFAVALLLLHPTNSADLGARTLANVSKDFVAHRRAPGAGITFFDHPKPYSEWLCRVNAYYVPEKVLTGKLVQKQDWWADNLDVTTLYGVWRQPHLGPATDASRHKACDRFRDFDNLFSAKDPADPERGAYVLDRIIALLASGNLNVPLSCAATDPRGRPNCDARKVLRSVSLRRLRSVEQVSEQEIDGGARHTDELWLEPDKHARDELIGLKIVSDQHFGKQSVSEGDIRSVDVIIPCVC